MIHESATVDRRAELGRDVRIGANCFIGPGIVLGDGCVLHNNVTLTGHVVCGPKNEFFPCSVVGVAPQDIKYRGGDTRVEIGEGNVFRENVTVHAGTEVAGGLTRIGSRNLLLVGVHIAHDAILGSECILSNYVQLAGHVHVEDRVTMGGLIGVHHFTTIGTLSYVGGLTRIVNDVPPFMIVEGNPSRVRGFNETGMRRWGHSEQEIRSIRQAYRMLFGARATEFGASILDRLNQLESRSDMNGEVQHLCRSVRRSLVDGVYGRSLEKQRRDTDADRSAFYGAKDGKDEEAAS